jgi:serine acetyltransferase
VPDDVTAVGVPARYIHRDRPGAAP